MEATCCHPGPNEGVEAATTTTGPFVVSSQDQPQIGHAVPSRLATVDLEGAQHAYEAGVDPLLTSCRQQRFRRQLPARQAAPERLADHFDVPPQRLRPLVPPAHDGIEVLIPEEGKLTEFLQAAANQGTDQLKIAPGVGVADLAVLIEVEDADVGELDRKSTRLNSSH